MLLCPNCSWIYFGLAPFWCYDDYWKIPVQMLCETEHSINSRIVLKLTIAKIISAIGLRFYKKSVILESQGFFYIHFCKISGPHEWGVVTYTGIRNRHGAPVRSVAVPWPHRGHWRFRRDYQDSCPSGRAHAHSTSITSPYRRPLANGLIPRILLEPTISLGLFTPPVSPYLNRRWTTYETVE